MIDLHLLFKTPRCPLKGCPAIVEVDVVMMGSVRVFYLGMDIFKFHFYPDINKGYSCIVDLTVSHKPWCFNAYL